jgi:hypothetical protein
MFSPAAKSRGKQRGIRVASHAAMMTSNHQIVPKRSPAEPTAMLRWIFRRDTKAVTCEVRVCGKQTYDVCVLPHWDVSSSTIETFKHPTSALRRHAEIAWYFRQAGWSVVRDGASQAVGVAA